MKTPILLLLFCLPIPCVSAQGLTATPRGLGLETQEGGDQLARGWHQGRATVFGGYAEARFQYHDGELDDGRVRVLRWLGFRHDDTVYHSGSGTGRTWQDVQLRLGQVAKYGSLGTDFEANLVSPNLVFSGSVTWPSRTGRPARKPAALHPGLRFPFAQPLIHDGKTSLVEDFQFRRGKLQQGSWTSNKAYQLDGLMVVTNMYTPTRYYPAVDAYCRDSRIGGGPGAFIQASYRQYSKLYAAKPGVVELWFRPRETAVGQPVMQALGTAGRPAGLAVGAACNRLYLDLSQPHVMFAGTGGTNAYIRLSAPRSPALLRREFWLQGAWSDAGTGAFSLTRAARAAAPDLGMTDVAPRKQMLIATGTGSAAARQGNLSAPGHHMHHPISFYGH